MVWAAVVAMVKVSRVSRERRGFIIVGVMQPRMAATWTLSGFLLLFGVQR